MKLKPSDIKIGDRVRKDLGDIDGLANRIKKNTLGEPVTVDKNNNLINGFRRLTAWKKVNGEEPIEVFRYMGLASNREMEVEMAVTGKPFVAEELYDAGMEILSEEEAGAKKHPGGRGKTLSAGEQGIDTNAQTAKKLDIGKTKWYMIRAIFDPGLARLLAPDGKKKADKIRAKANEEGGVKTAYAMLQRLIGEKDKRPTPMVDLEGEELKYYLSLEGVLVTLDDYPEELTEKGPKILVPVLQQIEVLARTIWTNMMGGVNGEKETAQIEARG